MMLFTNKPKKEIRPIDRSDLIYFTNRLRNFIQFYEKFILIMDEETIQKLNKLKQYLEILSSERYDLLINDTSIIYNDVPSVDSPQFISQEYLDSVLNDPDLPF